MDCYELHAQYLVHACACALHKRRLDLPSFEFDASYFVKLLCAHHLSGLTYPVFRMQPDILGQEALERLKRDFRTEQLRDVSQEDALEEITEAFSEAGICFMVLKGIVLKRYFEKSYHRMMGDLDLLILEKDRFRAREVMESLGYSTELYEELYDDVYYRRPFLNVEVHVALGEDGDSAHPYFNDVWERAVQDKEYPVRYEMSPVDYYLYFVQHAVKHLKTHGTGIRTLIDFWQVRRKLLPTLDRAFLDDVLSELGSLVFEREFYELSEVWFDGKKGDDFQTCQMLHYLVLNSGLYGNEANVLFKHVVEGEDVQQAQSNKRRFFLRNIFPPRATLALKYPVLNRCPYLLPFCWFWRAVMALFKPQKIRREVRLYSEVTQGMDLHTELRTRFGFLSSSGSDENGAE